MRKNIAFTIMLILTIVWIVMGQRFAPFFNNGAVKAATVTNLSDTISDSRRGQPADHLLAFRIVSSVDPSDTVVIKFDDTRNAFNLSLLSPVNILDFDFSVDGIDYDIVDVCADINDLTVSVDTIQDEITFTACAGNTIAAGSDIRIEIGKNATSGGDGVNQISNPSSGNSFFIEIAGTFGDTGVTAIVTIPSSGIGVSATIREEVVTPPSGGGGGTTEPMPTTGNLRMIGKAYPNAFIVVLKDGVVAGTKTAYAGGDFEITIKSIPSNKIYKFGIYAEDDLRLLSPTLNFTLSINTNQITEVSNIYFPPTISLSDDKINQGDKLTIYGSTYPKNLIVNFISPSFKASSLSADKNGHWSYDFDSSDYTEGKYFTKAKSIFAGGEQTDYSEELGFVIEKGSELTPTPTPKPTAKPTPGPKPRKCNGADINNDSRVDIVDFSILMHFWNSRNPSNPCADINQSGGVDLYDFSIIMYYWTD